MGEEDRLELAGKVEFYLGKIRLSHLQNIVRVGHEDIATIAVHAHELVFPFFECFESLWVVAFYPTSLVKADGFPTALCSIFV